MSTVNANAAGTVQIVPNKKTGSLYQPTTSGKFYRVQVSSQQVGESVDANGNGTGFNISRKLVGFSYHPTEEACKALVASAVSGLIPGKVIYIDQLEPISTEATGYGQLYPYPFRYNGQELSLEQRLAIQVAAVEAELSLQQSGKPIYRKKIHTTIMDSKSVLLSPDNMDEVNAFVGTVLAEMAKGSGATAESKAARLAELKAIPAAKRTAEQKAEMADLM